MSALTIASVCPRMDLSNPERNLRFFERWLRKAAAAGADLALFPEAFLSGYAEDFMLDAGCVNRKRYLNSAEPIPGSLTDRLCELSRRFGVFLCVGVREREGRHCYNTQVMIGPRKGLLGKYRKVHIGPTESWAFQPGDTYPVFRIKGVTVGIMICRDKSFPEVARILALEGAHLILAPHSTTDSTDHRFTDWSLKLCTARAMENGCFVVANNGIYDCPLPKTLRHGGYSFALDPFGKVIHCDHGPGGREKMALILIDTAKVRERRKWEGRKFNLFSRHPETYRRLIARSRCRSFSV